MSYKLIIFINPLDTKATLQLDSGAKLIGKPTTHHTGRLGTAFDIPDDAPQGNGCTLTLQHEKKVNIVQRALLWLRDSTLQYPWDKFQEAAFATDDFYMQDEIVCPEIPPEIPPIIPPPASNQPIDIIEAVYSTGLYDLSTKTGCGKFTEECCKSLHILNSIQWGHIKKTLPQNHYPEVPYTPGGNVHAVDAIMLLVKSGDTEPGVYDIIKQSESPDAEPAFNRVNNIDPTLWYYPA